MNAHKKSTLARKPKSKQPTPVVSESITQEAHRLINGDRRNSYGRAEDSFRDIADGWSILIGYPISSSNVAQMMIWLKQVREKNKHHRDNWVDMAGYADLGNTVSTL